MRVRVRVHVASLLPPQAQNQRKYEGRIQGLIPPAGATVSMGARQIRGTGRHDGREGPATSEAVATTDIWGRPKDKAASGGIHDAGKNKWVISFGLYGSDPKYLMGALRNLELQPRFFPGWTLRFYTDDTVPRDIVAQLTQAGAEVVNMAQSNISGGIAGMFWRFLVADDPAVERFIVRDADSRLNARDAIAVAEWCRSGIPVHSG